MGALGTIMVGTKAHIYPLYLPGMETHIYIATVMVWDGVVHPAIPTAPYMANIIVWVEAHI